MSDTPEMDAEHTQFAMGGFTLDFCRKLERERDKARNLVQSGIRAQASLNEALDKTLYDLRIAREQNAKLRDIAERAVELAVQCNDGPCERDAAKLSAEKEWIGKEMPEPQQGGLGEIREVVQKELQKMRYEVFCDIAYFDQWAVRPVGVSRWGHCYHLPSKEEAEGLAKQLEELERERDEALDTLTTIHRWIERNHPDGFIDSQSYYQNLERITDGWYERLESFKRERDDVMKLFQGGKRAQASLNQALDKTLHDLYEAREKSDKLRDIAERAIDFLTNPPRGLGFQTFGERLRAELDKLKKGAK